MLLNFCNILYNFKVTAQYMGAQCGTILCLCKVTAQYMASLAKRRHNTWVPLQCDGTIHGCPFIMAAQYMGAFAK